MLLLYGFSLFLLHGFSLFLLHRCIMFLLHRFSVFPLHRFSLFLLHGFSLFLLHRFSVFPLHRCSMLPLHRLSMFLLHRCSMFPLHRFNMPLKSEGIPPQCGRRRPFNFELRLRSGRRQQDLQRSPLRSIWPEARAPQPSAPRFCDSVDRKEGSTGRLRYPLWSAG